MAIYIEKIPIEKIYKILNHKNFYFGTFEIYVTFTISHYIFCIQSAYTFFCTFKIGMQFNNTSNSINDLISICDRKKSVSPKQLDAQYDQAI